MILERKTKEQTAWSHPLSDQGSVAGEGHGHERLASRRRPSVRSMAIKRTTRSCRCEFGSQDCVSAFRPDTATPWHDMRVDNIKPQMVPFVFPVRHCVGVLASGRLLNLGYAAGHPFFEMSCSFKYHVWQSCTFLQPGKRSPSPSLPRNVQFVNVSRLKALSGRQERCLPLAGKGR